MYRACSRYKQWLPFPPKPTNVLYISYILKKPTNFMNREQIISKIQSMLKLQESTDFEGEASAAAKMIDKLCKQYGISVQEAAEPIAKDEEFGSFKRMDNAYVTLLNAVAQFYDAKLYMRTDHQRGVKTYQIIGTEAQQIQTKLYFEFLHQQMDKEADLAHKAEKVICHLKDTKVQRSFRTNFKKAFAQKVSFRLREMKIAEGRVHEDAAAVSKKVGAMRFTNRKVTGGRGQGAQSGSESGSNVSLNRQTSGSKRMALSAG